MFRQTLFESILLTENLAIILIMRFVSLPSFLEESKDILLAVVLGLNLLSLAIKLLYYGLLHTWSALSCSCQSIES